MLSESEVKGLQDLRFDDECRILLFKIPVDPLTAILTNI